MIFQTLKPRPNTGGLRSLRKAGTAALLVFTLSTPLAGAELSRGIVFHDRNENGKFDAGDRPIANVAVSNGREIVTTDRNGRFQISHEDADFIFVLKPSNWTTPTDETMIPQFFAKVSSEKPSSDLQFPLQPQEEPDTFEVLVFGDTQPRNRKEIHYFAQDTLPELQGAEAAFGITLGDLVFDNLDIFEDLNEAVATIGVPWRNVLGNHDLDLLAPTDAEARERYFSVYGPSYYSFSYGSAHFIVLDNVQKMPPAENGSRRYRTGLGENQMQFVENELARIGSEKQVFLLSHIPWVNSTGWADGNERNRFFELLANYPKAVSFASHRHMHIHEMIGQNEGFPGKDPHHLVVMGSTCGSWWRGAPDHLGIPHAFMRCGTPTGYGWLTVTPTDWSLRYKASRRTADYQMNIHAPNAIRRDRMEDVTIFANVFNALPDAEVKFRLNSESEWQKMEASDEVDPFYAAAYSREAALGDVPFRPMPNPQPSTHLWKATLPENLDPGFHTIEIQSTDRWGTYHGQRLIQVR